MDVAVRRMENTELKRNKRKLPGFMLSSKTATPLNLLTCRGEDG
jgi:hypothetical protein